MVEVRQLTSEEPETGGPKEQEAATGLASDLPSTTVGGRRQPRDLQFPWPCGALVHHVPRPVLPRTHPSRASAPAVPRVPLWVVTLLSDGPCHFAPFPPIQRLVPPPHTSRPRPPSVQKSTSASCWGFYMYQAAKQTCDVGALPPPEQYYSSNRSRRHLPAPGFLSVTLIRNSLLGATSRGHRVKGKPLWSFTVKDNFITHKATTARAAARPYSLVELGAQTPSCPGPALGTPSSAVLH